MATKIVITGGPGSGKSSLINCLVKSGYTIIPEASRQLIQVESKKSDGILPWHNLAAFANLCLEKMKDDFHNYDSDNSYQFYDRGLPDILAYLNLKKIKPLPGLEETIKQNRYFEHVYWCPPWSKIYVNDSERPQTYQEAFELGLEIKNIYQKYRYKIIEIPKASVELRASFILRHLSSITVDSGNNKT